MYPLIRKALTFVIFFRKIHKPSLTVRQHQKQTQIKEDATKYLPSTFQKCQGKTMKS